MIVDASMISEEAFSMPFPIHYQKFFTSCHHAKRSDVFFLVFRFLCKNKFQRSKYFTADHQNIASSGFTLMEVVAVLILVTILTAVIMSHASGIQDANLQAEVNALKTHLRYAQSLAMNDVSPNQWGISLTPGSYTLVRFDGSSTTSPFSFPGENSATHTL